MEDVRDRIDKEEIREQKRKQNDVLDRNNQFNEGKLIIK